MAGLIYPDGAELGGYILETLLEKEHAAGVYLARTPAGEKVLLYLMLTPPDEQLIHEIFLASRIRHRGIIPNSPLLTDPVPMVETPCIPGLTIPECRLSGMQFTEEEICNLLLMTADALQATANHNCRCRSLAPEHVLLSNDGEIKLRFSGIFPPVRHSMEEEFFSFARNLFPMLADGSSGRLQQVLDDLARKKATLTEVIRQLENLSQGAAVPAPHAGSKKGKIIAAVICGALLFAAAAAGIVRCFPAQKKTEVTRSQIGQKRQPAVPKIHEIKVISAAEENKEQNLSAEKTQPVKKKRIVRKIRKKEITRSRPAKPVPPAPPIRKKAEDPLAAWAAKAGNLQELQRCIENGCNVELPDADGKTAMEYAAMSGWRAMIELLLKSGAKITPQVLESANNANTLRYLKNLQSPPPPPRPVKAQKQPPQRPPKSGLAARKLIVPNTARWEKPRLRNWNLTLEQAVIKARASQKNILVLFTGADWCGPCKFLEKNVLSTSDFRRAARKCELVYINFPRGGNMPPAQKRYNTTLRKDLTRSGGVPRVVLLDRNCRKLGEISGAMPLKNYLEQLKRILKR